MSKPRLLLPEEYVRAATRHINKATSHVSFLCMIVTDDEATDELIDALSNAAKRGVDVTVAADVFTYGELGGHFIPLKYYTKESRATTKMGHELTKNGVKFRWLGRFSALLFSGRTHIKCLVVDDTIYSFGGVNLDDESIGRNDLMFQIQDLQLAEELRDDIARLIAADGKNFSYRSHEFSYLKKSKVLVDGGFQGDSIIYRRAVKLASEANEVVLVSQYCPTGKLSRILKKKKRKAKLYFNPPKNADGINKFVIQAGNLFSKHKTHYRRKQYLHAKFILFTMPSGEKIALTGSHNFVWGGVVLGTREIALETSEPTIVRQLESFFEKHVK